MKKSVKRKLNEIGKYDELKNVCHVDIDKVRDGNTVKIPKVILKHNLEGSTPPVKLIFLFSSFTNIDEIIYNGEIEFESCYFNNSKYEIHPDISTHTGLEKIKFTRCTFEEVGALEVMADKIVFDHNSYENTGILAIPTTHLDFLNENHFGDKNNCNIIIAKRWAPYIYGNLIRISNCNINAKNLTIESGNSDDDISMETSLLIEKSNIELDSYLKIRSFSSIIIENSGIMTNDEVTFINRESENHINDISFINSTVLANKITTPYASYHTDLENSKLDSEKFILGNPTAYMVLKKSTISATEDGLLYLDGVITDNESKIKAKNLFLESTDYPIVFEEDERKLIEANTIYANGNIVTSHDDKPADISLIEPRNNFVNILKNIQTKVNNGISDNTNYIKEQLEETLSVKDIIPNKNSNTKEKVMIKLKK